MFASRLASSSSRSSSVLLRSGFGKQLQQQQQRFMSVINISDNEATDKFIKMNEKSILYFTATWCPPCKLIKPVYESLSDEYPNISFGKIDIDDNQDSAMEYEISSVPTFLFFNGKGEKKYGQFSGADQEQLKKTLDDLNNEP
ncbi:hypothetical protein FRACYDRAFT_189178 [Fragilariopsis cylindrus CCMP1102]|uniref:Thioredoxin domain-containing protein n=2 Tax=Fragilariopsis cylindrus CCMP1102 TaxID=635003 RepID=A0A1E7F829_9STRA|nr:hypothetical protein FRACYDRAFT_189178 [Fragilariopsis cylindrus CCMP1102]|eukprot:OEU14145.1 hypothetical protein FRACYDRAFT_189178 [Fragilariopsis cylindrus CCMP1102]